MNGYEQRLRAALARLVAAEARHERVDRDADSRAKDLTDAAWDVRMAERGVAHAARDLVGTWEDLRPALRASIAQANEET